MTSAVQLARLHDILRPYLVCSNDDNRQLKKDPPRYEPNEFFGSLFWGVLSNCLFWVPFLECLFGVFFFGNVFFLECHFVLSLWSLFSESFFEFFLAVYFFWSVTRLFNDNEVRLILTTRFRTPLRSNRFLQRLCRTIKLPIDPISSMKKVRFNRKPREYPTTWPHVPTFYPANQMQSSLSKCWLMN